ncbi:MAG TPA: redoxin domain-containing protein [Planctomycetes bacterium]|nr:redoxin domain-containing protein [Planctomycetota bacterium]
MKIKFSRLIIAFLCLIVCGHSQARETGKLPIEGQVVDYTARPVAGAEIAVYEQVYRNGEATSKMIAPIVKTDRQGRFALQADAPTQYRIFIIARNKELALAWDVMFNSNKAEKGYFLLVSEKACTVTGIVVDSDNKTVSGAIVQALPKTSYLSRLDQSPILAPKEWFTTTTDSKGRFQFNQFAADVSCDFYVKSPRSGSTYKFTPQVLNSCGFEVWRSDIRLVLPREGDVKGRVVEARTGKPVGGVELTIQAEREREDILNRYCVRTITVDANGTFECLGLPEGKSKIELNKPENETARWIAKPVEVNVAAGQTLENVKMLLEKGELIECTVREYGSEKPLADIRVSVYGESGSAMSFTDETGTVSLRIPPGEFQAYASGKGYISWRVNEPVIVKEGKVKHLEIMLDKSPTVAGSVVDADGRPAKDVSVTAHPFGDHVYTDQDGKFSGGYDEERAGQDIFVMARDPERSLAALIQTKELKKPVELTLGPALTVKGQITDPNGIGIPAARVSLCIDFARCLSQLGREVLTNSQGYYAFNAIPPKHSDFNYRVSVYAAGFGPKEYDRISIEGKPGATTEVQAIELVPANVSISGSVVDANGLPAAQVPILLHGADSFDQPDKSAVTDKDGRFVIHRICKGPLRLQANFSSSPGGAGFLYAQGGNQNIKIVLGQKGAHRSQILLVGNPLPELKDLGIKLSTADIEGKRILVCFFDMEQRPSRHCMIQLSKQAEQLKSKGVTTIAVQASKINQEDLNQWVKKYNIPFPVGMIQGDIEKIRSKWGVKSLPWLILTMTDSKHIIQAEGFGIAEIGDILE